MRTVASRGRRRTVVFGATWLTSHQKEQHKVGEVWRPAPCAAYAIRLKMRTLTRGTGSGSGGMSASRASG